MDNTMPTSWWKMMAGGAALAVFNIFAYIHLDSAHGPALVVGSGQGPLFGLGRRSRHDRPQRPGSPVHAGPSWGKRSVLVMRMIPSP